MRGFSRFIFYLVFKICLNFQSFSECRLIFFYFNHFFSIFWRFKTRNFEQNHRQGSRSGSRSRAWTKTFFWCILKRDKDSKNPGSQFSFENESFLSMKLCQAMQFIIFGRIKKLPVRISVRTAKQCRFFFNFSSIFKGKKQQIDAIFSDFAIFETIFFRKCSSLFWFFVAVAGKISSSCSQSRRKS